MKKSLSTGFLLLVFCGCYSGPGLTRVESNAIIRSSQTLNPFPIIEEQSRDFGERHVAPVFDRTLTPLILDPDEMNPEDVRERNYEENMRRQEDAIRQMDEENGF